MGHFTLGQLARPFTPLPGEACIQKLTSRVAGRAWSRIRHSLSSLIRPVEMSNLCAVIAVHHKRRRDNLRSGCVQKPEQESAVQRHGEKLSTRNFANTGL